MKKKFILFLLILFSCLLINDTNVSADSQDYTSFARINVSSGKLLRDYSSDEIDDGLNKIKRKFGGWRFLLFNKNVECTFISETIFSVYNNGKTPVTYTVNVQSKQTTKTSVSCTGSISYSISGNIKKFKNGLDTSLKITGSYEATSLVSEEENLKLEVDPQTICVVYIQGKGLLTNGVAKYFYFWMTEMKGGFEYFTITDSYLRIEKIKL